jgi:hypothetical protein
MAHVTGVLGNIFDYFILSFDVAAGILPKVGIECCFHKKKQPNREKRWRTLVEHLVG